MERTAVRLNLGACDRVIENFISVDLVPPADVVTDLSQAWPWPDSTIDEIVGYDIVEHLPDRIHCMNEMHRVMKPGARATIETPNASRGAGFYQDPTHKSPFVMNSFQYFEDGAYAHTRLARAYGITARFKVVELHEREYKDKYEPVWKITAVLEAVKS